MVILTPILILTALGVIFGVGLAIAAKRFCVVTDPRIEKIYERLPGANCGACGMPGCIGFAEGLIKGDCTIERCVASKDQARMEIARIIGVATPVRHKFISTLHCHGGKTRVKDKYRYSGINDCLAANTVMGGPKACIYGCIGFGSCVHVCPFGAIAMGPEGLPQVDEGKCTGCGKCTNTCPKKLFTLRLHTASVYIACSSHATGKDTKAVCPVGCIGCKLCEKACAFDAIHVTENCARIDYQKCTACGACVKTCPVKCIHIQKYRETKG